MSSEERLEFQCRVWMLVIAALHWVVLFLMMRSAAEERRGPTFVSSRASIAVSAPAKDVPFLHSLRSAACDDVVKFEP